jgi:hypothetical protein
MRAGIESQLADLPSERQDYEQNTNDSGATSAT